MRIRIALLSLVAALAACSVSPTAPVQASEAPLQSQYVGPGSTGDQAP
jgi:hypothetical protein